MKSQNKMPTFLVDEMLGNLVRWLRIFGFDTMWAGDLRESESEDIDLKIVNAALMSNRILVTRDKELTKRARKYGANVIYIPNNSNLIQQLVIILREIKINIKMLENFVPSKCPVCNGNLVKVDKSKIINGIPPRSRERYHVFWICEKCGKVYWQGSHWKNIKEVMKRVIESLKTIQERK